MLKSVNGRDYMTEQPVTIAPDANIFDAIHLILEHKISGITVVDASNNIVGIISEMDCLRAILDGTYYGQVGGSVEHYMTTDIQCVEPDLDIIDVAKMMLDNNRRRMPIIENGEFIGQFSCRSILKAIKDFDVPQRKDEEAVYL